jgi:hypothetical protein
MKKADGEHIVVYRNTSQFCAWPFNGGFWQFADGELAVGFMRASCSYATPESTNHGTIDGDSCEEVLVRSFDGGRTWPADTVKPVFKRAELDAQVRATSWLPGLPVTSHDPRADGFCVLAGYGIPPESLRDRLYVLVSKDRGHTWEKMVRAPACGFFSLYGRPSTIVRPDGMLLLFAHGSRLKDAVVGEAGFTQSEKEAIPLVFGSRNGGVTWGLIGEITPTPAMPMAIMPYPILLKDGRILAAVRRQFGPAFSAHTQVYESTDGGRSWRFLSRPNDWGAPANLVELPDGRLVCVYGYRQPSYGVRAAVSEDGGATWGEEIIVRDGGGSWDVGYPRTMLRPDGKLITVYYFNDKADPIQMDGGVRHIAATIWSV